MADYDQRWIRRVDSGYKSASSKHQICDACGDREGCGIRRVLAPLVCGVYKPVLGFRSIDGLHEPTWNTFRRGLGSFRRYKKGAIVRLYVNPLEVFAGEGRVSETYQGALGSLLEHHAGMNHLMLANDERAHAETVLLRVLVALYGRNYAAPESEYSVVYVEKL